MSKIPTIFDLQGNVITIADLPKPNGVRWTANKKTIVVRAVQANLIQLEEVLKLYNMNENEFNFWVTSLASLGQNGLKVTHFQKNKRKKAAQ